MRERPSNFELSQPIHDKRFTLVPKPTKVLSNSDKARIASIIGASATLLGSSHVTTVSEPVHLGAVPALRAVGDTAEVFLRELPGEKYYYKTEEEIFKVHPGLEDAYHTSIERWINHYRITDPRLVQGLKDAIFREAFDSGDRVGGIMTGLTESQIKSTINAILRPAEPIASQGLMNTKAYRINRDIYHQLPPEVQQQLVFNEELGYVDPVSLTKFLNPDSSKQYANLDRGVLLLSATLAQYKDEIIQKSKEHGYTNFQTTHIASVIACCSTPPNEYGFSLLYDPDSAHWYFSDPQHRFYTYDNRGIEQGIKDIQK